MADQEVDFDPTDGPATTEPAGGKWVGNVKASNDGLARWNLQEHDNRLCIVMLHCYGAAVATLVILVRFDTRIL
jgi:hypothetical protein